MNMDDRLAKCSCGCNVKRADVCTIEGCKTLYICIGCNKEVDRCLCATQPKQ